MLLVSGTLEAGGAERDISGMANYWAGKGWRVTLATFTGPQVPDFYVLAPQVERQWLDDSRRTGSRPAKLAAIWARVRTLRKLLRALRPDAVISFIDVPNVLTLIAASGLGLRVVVSERGSPDRTLARGLYSLARPWRLLVRALYRRAAAVTALNPETADWIRRRCGVRVHVIPPALRVMPDLACVRERRIVFIGRLHRVKGGDVLLRAYALIHAEFPDWRLTLIGDGPEKESLERLGAQLGVGADIEFIGTVREVEQWMARAGLVVLPSRSEAFGNVVLESMSMGAAVVSTDCAGPVSLIVDGENGRIVPAEDEAALAAAMRELLLDDELRQRLGREATKVRHRFLQDEIMNTWESIVLERDSAA